MGFSKYGFAAAALVVASYASPAPQAPDFPAITAAPSVANGPVANGDGDQTASLATTFAPPAPSNAASPPQKRTFWVPAGCSCPWYDPFCAWTQPYCPKKSSSKSAPQPTTTSTPSKPSTTSKPAVTTTPAPACPTSAYTPYYPALKTGYTTDPALSATKTTTANQPCATQPEDGTYCGFINPLDPCAPQPDGYGPVPKPDTADAFLQDPELHAFAQKAPATVPSVGNTVYKQVFRDLNAATSAQSYLGLRTLESYDVQTCAAFCDCNELCTAFNIFVERDPSLNPSTNASTAPTVWGRDCPNPPSMTTFKCTLWGSSIDASTATNKGETREQFQVVITGSDGYDRTDVATPPAPQPNPPKPPKDCGNKGQDAPKYCIGKHFFPGPYNPHACYDYALSLNVANKNAGFGQQCSYFNAYYLFKNGKPHGTYCNLYNSEIDIGFATYTGGVSGGDKYECKQSWGFSIAI